MLPGWPNNLWIQYLTETENPSWLQMVMNLVKNMLLVMNKEQWDDKRAHKLSLRIWTSQLESIGGLGENISREILGLWVFTSCMFLERSFIHFTRFTKWTEPLKDRDTQQLILLLLIVSQLLPEQPHIGENLVMTVTEKKALAGRDQGTGEP